jgi:exodeoxyribonuclease VII large subunit
LERETDRLRRSGRLLLERRRTALEHCAGRLRALSPRATLTRGYAIVRRDDSVVRSATALAIDDRVDVELADGRFAGRVEEVQP